MNTTERLVQGSIDMHVHHGPDAHIERRLDALQVAIQAEEAGISLVVAPVLPDFLAVKGDATRLAQALDEILQNALIFTPEGGQVTVEVGALEEGGQHWVLIAVRDTGPGISPEEQEQVFDRFFRGRLAESGHTAGTGLGLSIAWEIVRAHGGRVTVESEVGAGSTFTMWFPSS